MRRLQRRQTRWELPRRGADATGQRMTGEEEEPRKAGGCRVVGYDGVGRAEPGLRTLSDVTSRSWLKLSLSGLGWAELNGLDACAYGMGCKLQPAIRAGNRRIEWRFAFFAHLHSTDSTMNTQVNKYTCTGGSKQKKYK